jgi:hypothetical protein
MTGRLWDLASGRCLRTLEGHTERVQSVALTPDGRLALSGGFDGAARLWDLASGRCLRTLEGHTERVQSVALTPDARLALSAGPDGTRLWELANGRCLRTLGANTENVGSVALTPDGRLALTGAASDGTVRLWDLASGRCLRTLEGHLDSANSVALTSDGRVAVAGGMYGSALWHLGSGRCLRVLDGMSAATITPDGRFVLSAEWMKAPRLWELDWDYEFPEPVDWDEGARALLEAFLCAQVPYADPLTDDGPLRRGESAWNEADFDLLLHALQDAGYGWLRPEGVLRELERMAGGMAEAPLEELGDLIYYEVGSRRHPGPANLFIVEPSAGPVRAVRLDHPTKTWKFDPWTVHYSLEEDFDKGNDRISRVDRARAEEIAQLLESPLASETQLRQLMREGASATED